MLKSILFLRRRTYWPQLTGHRVYIDGNKCGIMSDVDIYSWFKSLPKVKPEVLTRPSDIRKGIICTDQCEQCPLFLIGCAKRCVRFPDLVCGDCPCRASFFAGSINPVKEG